MVFKQDDTAPGDVESRMRCRLDCEESQPWWGSREGLAPWTCTSAFYDISWENVLVLLWMGTM